MNKTVAKKILYETLGHFSDKGSELLFSCPACGHHKRKFSVNLDKNVFKCWVCDYHGRNIRRIIRRFGSYIQLQKWDQITDRSDITRFAELFMDEQSGEGEAKIELPQQFVSLTNKNLPLSANRALRYLKERGITQQQIIRWKIGFCYDGEYGGRIIIPSFGTSGYPNYFIARSYVGHGMKYKNPQASKNVVFNDLFTNWNDDLVIVEGVFDAIIAGNSVPILGSTLSEKHKLFEKIVENDTPVYVALDPDAESKALKLIQKLIQYDVEVYKVKIEPYNDVAEMSKEEYQKRKSEAILMNSNSYLDYSISSI